MNSIVLIFAVLISIAGLVLIANPNYIFGVFRRYGDTLGLQVFAVIVRVVLGLALLFSAPESNYPVALEILGWLTLTVALALGVIGRKRFKSIIDWSLDVSPSVQRVMGLAGILFGVFLFYAVY